MKTIHPDASGEPNNKIKRAEIERPESLPL